MSRMWKKAFACFCLLTGAGALSVPGLTAGDARANAAAVHETVPADSLWKAGVARMAITPEQPVWMGGYASRNRPAEGKQHDLWAKALALEDRNGERAVLITVDLVGIPKSISDPLRQQLQRKYGLSPAQVLLNSSHTHSGPALSSSLSDIYPSDPAVQDKVAAYSESLVGMLAELTGKALSSLQPARLSSGQGITRFQVNRRNNSEASLLATSSLEGPGDHAVPVIKVETASGKLLAVAFGYACHPTVLSGYEWSGDYPGFAQIELEKLYPGTTALFFQGAGADQNPIPRRTVPLAIQYGKTLAAAVERVLSEEMRVLSPELKTTYAEIPLPLSPPPSDEELEKIREASADYRSRWAGRMLEMKRSGKALPAEYPYPLQVWKLGDQAVMSLGGEVVVGYSIALKRLFGEDIFVLGYSNDVMAYIPTEVVLKEGGYEGCTSQQAYGLPSAWAPGIEGRILGKMEELAREAGVAKQGAEAGSKK